MYYPGAIVFTKTQLSIMKMFQNNDDANLDPEQLLLRNQERKIEIGKLIVSQVNRTEVQAMMNEIIVNVLKEYPGVTYAKLVRYINERKAPKSIKLWKDIQICNQDSISRKWENNEVRTPSIFSQEKVLEIYQEFDFYELKRLIIYFRDSMELNNPKLLNPKTLKNVFAQISMDQGFLLKKLEGMLENIKWTEEGEHLYEEHPMIYFYFANMRYCSNRKYREERRLIPGITVRILGVISAKLEEVMKNGIRVYPSNQITLEEDQEVNKKRVQVQNDDIIENELKNGSHSREEDIIGEGSEGDENLEIQESNISNKLGEPSKRVAFLTKEWFDILIWKLSMGKVTISNLQVLARELEEAFNFNINDLK